MRSTSIQAYAQIKASGLLSELRMQVYEALVLNGPMTAQETWHVLRDETAKEGKAQINGITPRFSELKRLGVVVEKQIRPCKISGRDVIEWEVVDTLPKNPTAKQNLEERLKSHRSQIVKLEAALFELEQEEKAAQ